MQRSILSVAMVLGVTSSGLAATHLVGPGQSIQAAIEVAADGDEVVVAAGTYYEAVDLLGKAIALRSADGPATTMIDATGILAPTVSCMSGETTATLVEGFTLTGGSGYAIGANRHGGGMFIDFSNPTVRNCVFTGNEAAAGGGLAALTMTSGLITDCVFEGNTATAGGYYGGGGAFLRGGLARMTNCVFTDNLGWATAKGGAVSLFLGSPTLTNCLFVGNEARHGGGVMNQKASATLVNCTFYGNHAASSGGGLRCLYDAAVTEVSNGIFWGNTAASSGDEILDQSGAVTTVRFSTVQGGWSGAGEEVASTDPQLMDPSNGDYRLTVASPCIDAGDNAAVTVAMDLDGNERIANGTVDVGAYEAATSSAPCAADVTGNGFVNFQDLTAILLDWGVCDGCPTDVDGDGLVELMDLLMVLESWGPCS